MVKIIPMAGAGQRFVNEGYKTPKPLLPINNQAMVIAAADSLPQSEKTIFICQSDHVEQFGLTAALSSYGEISTVEGLTEGQACTCMIASEQISANEEIIIGASDNGLIYDKELFQNLRQEADVLVFGFTANPAVIQKPEAYGWIQVDSNNNVTGVSVKKAISDTPLNDWAVVGAFYFKRNQDFMNAVNQMIMNNTRINNEFYVDECINNAISMGLKVKLMPVEHYICWGTPNDYETYIYWQKYYQQELPKYLKYNIKRLII
ncbi:MAG: sugar phosphate nucleotidyltransferase [Brevinema sp.]